MNKPKSDKAHGDRKPENENRKPVMSADELKVTAKPSPGGLTEQEIAGYSALAEPLPSTTGENPADVRVSLGSAEMVKDKEGKPIRRKSDSPWRSLVPSRIHAIKFEVDPDLFFEAQSRRSLEERDPVVCLDARRCSKEQIADWVERFVLNLYAQPEQSSSATYEPLLVVVCDESGIPTGILDWIDIDVVATADAESDAEEIYKLHVQSTLESIVGGPMSTAVPGHLTTVDGNTVLSPEEIGAWDEFVDSDD